MLCFSGTAHDVTFKLQSKSFIPFPVFTLKNRLHIVSLSWSSLAASLVVLGWLVDNQLVATHTKSQIFPEITQIHCFYSILF